MKSSRSRNRATNTVTTLPLSLSVHPNDGCLLTAPLSTVLNAATDSLYRDLHDMIYGSITLAVPSSSSPTPTTATTSTSATTAAAAAAITTTDVTPNNKFSLHTGTMASFSFAQRRYALASQLLRHARSISHTAALLSSHLPLTSGNTTSTQSINSLQPREGELSHIVTALTNTALHQVQTCWIQADEAQDALFFQHADLYKHRKQVHDILGAMEVLLSGSWNDGMSWDVALTAVSPKLEEDCITNETQDDDDDDERDILRHRLQRALQAKWILGEEMSSSPWNMTLEQDGCVLKLTHGDRYQDMYPLVAYLTVLSEQPPNALLALQEEEQQEEEEEEGEQEQEQEQGEVDDNRQSSKSLSQIAPWTLLSIQVNHRPKMDEPNYQLYPSNRQVYDLHRICVGNMTKEESRAWNQALAGGQGNDIMARPLDRLFDTMHTFGTLLQMEILWAQAQGLKKSSWAEGDIVIEKPVWNSQIMEEQILAVLVIHFWDVEDRFGRPTLGSIQDGTGTVHYYNGITPRRLTLQVQAFRRAGISVYISGGNTIRNIIQNSTKSSSSSYNYTRYMKQLEQSLTNPFMISMSDALLASASLCAHIRCATIVEIFQRNSLVLPPWMHLLSQENGCIAVAAEITYTGTLTHSSQESVILFHLTCETKTGRFVTTFPRSFALLRRLACNDMSASETQSLRYAMANMHSMNSSMVKRKNVGIGFDKDLTGRYIRDAFDSLNRSMDVLGKRVGVGEWDNSDSTSSALRTKYIDQACDDMRPCLMLCCALACSFGIACVALGISLGVDAIPDMGGGPIDGCNIKVPPICVLMNQRLVIKEASEAHDRCYVLERKLIGASTHFTDHSLITSFYDIVVEQSSLHAAQHRIECSLRYLKDDERESKRMRTEQVSHSKEITKLSAKLVNTFFVER